MAAKSLGKETYAVFAGELVAAHLDSLVRFYTFDHRRSIVKVVTAELREIMHKGGSTFIQYGEYGEREAELPHDARVIINPLRDYSDVARFLGNDQIAASEFPQ